MRIKQNLVNISNYLKKNTEQEAICTKTDNIEPFLKKSTLGRIVVFTSGKGGVGKTTVCSGCAQALASRGKKVLVIDMDTGLRNLDSALGVDGFVAFNVFDVLVKRVSWQKAIVPLPSLSGIYFLLADNIRKKESVNMTGFKNMLGEVSSYFDFVFIDCPAGVEYGFDVATAFASEAIIVATPEMPVLGAARQTADILQDRHPYMRKALLLNRYISKIGESGECALPEEAEEIVGVELCGVIPFDDRILRSAHKGEPIHKNSGIAFNEVTQIVSYFLT